MSPAYVVLALDGQVLTVRGTAYDWDEAMSLAEGVCANEVSIVCRGKVLWVR